MSGEITDESSLVSVAEDLAEQLDADIILYNGPIERPFDTEFIDICLEERIRDNVILILVTQGGDADAAYRIGRYLQRTYKHFTLYVSGYCKSAGTLIATGAHELVISDHGELGPLDVQMSKEDELWKMQSGLTISDTLDALQISADKAFTEFFLHMKAGSDDAITLRTATEIATKMTTGLFAPLYGQVDPMHVGEAHRAMSIAVEYGLRLLEEGRNIDSDHLRYLTSEYASHGFVIDRLEASELFANVREPSEKEVRLASELGRIAIHPLPAVTPQVAFLSSGRQEATQGNTQEEKHGTPQSLEGDDGIRAVS